MSTPFDLGPVIDALAFDTVTVSRSTRSYNSNGVSITASPSTFDIVASVQPLAQHGSMFGVNVSQQMQGQRLQGAIAIYSRVRLFAADPDSGDLSDDVTWQGVAYSVIHSEPWNIHNYYRSLCTRKVG